MGGMSSPPESRLLNFWFQSVATARDATLLRARELGVWSVCAALGWLPRDVAPGSLRPRHACWAGRCACGSWMACGRAPEN